MTKIVNKLGIEGENKWNQVILCLLAIVDGVLNLFTLWFNYRINLTYYFAEKFYKQQFAAYYKAKETFKK